MKYYKTSLFTFIVVFSLFNTSTAEVEDICITPEGNAVNFYQSMSEYPCLYGSYHPKCLKLMYEKSMDTFEIDNCRGIIHFDAVYFLANAVGFKPEYAYWLALFSQAVDFIEWVPYDNCG